MKKNHVITDASDTRRKVALTRSNAEEDAAFALKAALAIKANPSLLDGLEKVVSRLAAHDEAAAVLHEVFESGAARLYPAAYRAFLKARF